MEQEDTVKLQIRTNWRRLQLLRENFETARQALRLSATQLDQTVEDVTAPPQNVQGVQQQVRASTSGQQGLNLLQALNQLLGAQNSLIRIWIDYERSRINIYRDMGMMDIDPRGVWTDDFYQQAPPSSPSESNDTSKQFEKPVVLRVPADRGPVLARRGSDGKPSGGAADGQFALPRKIEVDEEPSRSPVAGGGLRGRVLGDAVGDGRKDQTVRQSGHRNR